MFVAGGDEAVNGSAHFAGEVKLAHSGCGGRDAEPALDLAGPAGSRGDVVVMHLWKADQLGATVCARPGQTPLPAANP